ncbi:Cuticle protein 16.8, partial [Stegodyphus mimosarum]
MSSFQVPGILLVSMLILLASSATAQDRATYLTNGAQIPFPPESQINTLSPSNYIRNSLTGKIVQIQPEEILEPYEFAYKMNDGNGTSQHRQEIRNENGDIRGSYGYVDPLGIYRNVAYYTDTNGYHAKVESNEPGLSNKNSANTIFVVQTPPVAKIIPENSRPLLLLP